MDEEVEGILTNVCSTCLSADRDLMHINNFANVYQIFNVLRSEMASEKLGEIQNEIPTYVCWECLSLLKKFGRFKKQVQNAQAHFRIIAMSTTEEGVGHTYLTQTLSNLEVSSKMEYDKVFNYTSEGNWDEEISITNKGIKVESEDFDYEILESVTQAPSPSHIYITENTNDKFMQEEALDDHRSIKRKLEYNTIQLELIQVKPANVKAKKQKKELTCNYTIEYMSEEDMLARREDMKLSVTYANVVHKCELCILGFKSQPQLEEHFESQHKSKPGLIACNVCSCYMEDNKYANHRISHYVRYKCKLCKHVEYSARLILRHVKSHLEQNVQNLKQEVHGHKKTQQNSVSQSKPSSKNTIEGYQCKECDMIFKNVRLRRYHVRSCHRERMQCDICKNTFVNRTTLIDHLKLHEGPLPKTECPTCHKKIAIRYLKNHIRWHKERGSFECDKCQKVFAHETTYQAHLKYSRAHAGEEVYKFPCPMCNKSYPKKEQMQDHFNYQHLGKTEHKCPICDKPIATRIQVTVHMMRVHGEKKNKPRNHVCQQCGIAFTDKKSLCQHEVIHSGERPLVCEICHQTFKQRASLYNHKKRVHKVYPTKKVVEFIQNKNGGELRTLPP